MKRIVIDMTGVATMAIAMALSVPSKSAAQEMVVPGFTQESFALLKQRAEAGDAKAQELYRKLLESQQRVIDAQQELLATNRAIDAAKAEIQQELLATNRALDAAKAEIRQAETAPKKLPPHLIAATEDNGQRDNAAKGLSGLFGVTFGSTMPTDRKCETNNLFSLAFPYMPEKAFNEFTDYLVFASPKTRTVYQVRGLHHCGTREEAESKIAEVAPMLEMKFGRRLQQDGVRKVMRFPGGDRIEVFAQPRNRGYSVLIDAISDANDVRDSEESMAMKTEAAQSLVSFLGKTLDEALPAAAVRPVNKDGHALAPLPGLLKTIGFTEMALRPLPNTKRVGSLSATCPGDADSCKTVFDRATTQLQLVFGPVIQVQPDGRVDFSANVSGAPYRFTLVQDPSGELVTLGIEDISACKADAEKAAAADLDAL